MKTLLSGLKTLRGRIFFWIGLAVLPIFWVWWMRPAYFTRWQRAAAWGWTIGYLMLLFVFWELLAQRCEYLSFAYPLVAFHMAGWLGLWLVFRICRPSLLEAVFLFFALGGPLSNITPAFTTVWWQHRLPVYVFILPLAVAGLHLVVEPIRRLCGLQTQGE